MATGNPVRTALYDEHVALDANIVDFHGFELPIWYSNITEEHRMQVKWGCFTFLTGFIQFRVECKAMVKVNSNTKSHSHRAGQVCLHSLSRP